MIIKDMYFGAGLGSTAFEIQLHRLFIRILRPRCWFSPYIAYRTKRWVFPEFVAVRILEDY